MILLIICPSCSKTSQMPVNGVPKGKLKTTCNNCHHKFLLNKEEELNCKLQSEKAGPEERIYGENGWKVQNPACHGIIYDLERIGGLIRSGFITSDTKILPPGATQFAEAHLFAQLKKFFDQKDQRDRARK